MDIRKRIIEGAAGLFKIYGIKAVTMDSISAHLGISKRTIYEVFTDKNDLVTGVLIWMSEKQKELVIRILDESENSVVAIFRMLQINRDYLQELSPAFQSDLKKFHHDVLMKKENKYEMPDYRNNMKVIERGIKEKLFRKEINPDLVNRCLFSLGRSFMDTELYPLEEFSRREVVKNIFINYLRGISTDEGLKLINKLERNF